MGGTWEEMGGNGRSNSRSTRGEIAVFSSKTPLLSVMDMNVTGNLHKTYIFVSFLPDSPPFPPVLSRILPYLPRPFLAPPGPFPEPPGDPAGTSGSIRGGHAIHILHMGAHGSTWEHLGGTWENPGGSCSVQLSTWENPAGSLGGSGVPGWYPVGRIVTQGPWEERRGFPGGSGGKDKK
jgi:hypothetical protein